jgi:hypothetical protein
MVTTFHMITEIPPHRPPTESSPKGGHAFLEGELCASYPLVGSEQTMPCAGRFDLRRPPALPRRVSLDEIRPELDATAQCGIIPRP